MPSRRPTGRPATWCSDRCKRAAYEERRAAVNGAVAVKVVEKDAHVINECANRVMDSPVACRRVLEHLAELAHSGQLHDPKWDSTIRSLTKLVLAAAPRR